MCSCGHPLDDHYPQGRCTHCHRDCGGTQRPGMPIGLRRILEDERRLPKEK